MTPTEALVLGLLCDDIPRDIFEIAELTALPVAVLEVVLAELEARGSVASREEDLH